MNKPNCAHCGDTGYLAGTQGETYHCQWCALPAAGNIFEITASTVAAWSMSGQVLDAILRERAAQDSQWGGAAHDDKVNYPCDWLSYIDKQIEKSIRETAPMVTGSKPYNEATRARLVKIAALAVAGIESMDRKEKT